MKTHNNAKACKYKQIGPVCCVIVTRFTNGQKQLREDAGFNGTLWRIESQTSTCWRSEWRVWENRRSLMHRVLFHLQSLRPLDPSKLFGWQSANAVGSSGRRFYTLLWENWDACSWIYLLKCEFPAVFQKRPVSRRISPALSSSVNSPSLRIWISCITWVTAGRRSRTGFF